MERLPASPADPPTGPDGKSTANDAKVSRPADPATPADPAPGHNEIVFSGTVVSWPDEGRRITVQVGPDCHEYPAIGEQVHVTRRRPVSPADTPTEPEWVALANDIRIVDGNHDMGAGALADALTRRGWTRRHPADPDMEERLAGDLRGEYLGIHNVACETQSDEPCQCADAFAHRLAARLIAQGWRRP